MVALERFPRVAAYLTGVHAEPLSDLINHLPLSAQCGKRPKTVLGQLSEPDQNLNAVARAGLLERLPTIRRRWLRSCSA